jgi:putative ABC transport system permease protein
MHALFQQFRYTLRLLRKSPGFTITGVLILSFGIGVNTAIFSLMDAAVLKPLPFPDPDRLVEVCTPYQKEWLHWIDYPDYLDLAAAQHSFESLAALSVPLALDLGGTKVAQQVRVFFVSPGLAKVTGLPIRLGRWFNEEEDVPHGPLVAVLTEPFWRTQFHSDPNIVGKNITLSGWSFQIVGVAPMQPWASWHAMACGLPVAQVYVPTNVIQTTMKWNVWDRSNHMIDCIGRLKKGVTIAQAQAELEIAHKNLVARYPDQDAGYGLRLEPLSERVVVLYSQTIWLLGAAAGCLLLISCANVANLLYARAVERRQEMSIRSALGGTRSWLLGQLLLETTFLSLLGATAGIAIAFVSVEIIRKLAPQDLYRLDEVGIDLRALLFVVGVTLSVSLVSGLLPSLSLSKTDVPSMLKADGGRTNTMGRTRQRTQALLVIGQVAVACVLLVGTGLLTRSFVVAQNVPLGFNPHQVLTSEISLTNEKYISDLTKARAFWDEVLRRVRQLPGLEAAAMNCDPPFKNGVELMAPFTVAGQPDPGPAHRPVLAWQMVAPDFFRTLQIPLVEGRDFTAQERSDNQKVIIVDQALAEKYWPGQSAIGKVINLVDDGACTVVGVAAHILYVSPDGGADSGPPAYVVADDSDTGETLLLRAKGDPMMLVPELREIIASIDPDVAIGATCTYDEMIGDNFSTRKLGVLMVSVFSGAALFLSAIGLYGMLAYSVNQRTREIGIRIALGASSSNILRLVVRRGIVMVGIGLIIGILIALVCSRSIESLLYEVRGDDPVTLGVAVLVLSIAGLIACLLPARRAVKVDPIAALRQ